MLHLKAVEVALLLALGLTAIWGAWSLQRQDSLQRKMIRLHVIANSDSQADQTLKLAVRDRVLEQATELLTQLEDMSQAKETLDGALPAIAATAASEIAAQGYDYPVSARLEDTEFPTRDYEGFALPGGKYLALRVVIGEGAGHNWWCVVYPPLCTAAAADWEQTALDAGLEEDDLRLITEENAEYQLKFRSVELWEQFRQWLGK